MAKKDLFEDLEITGETRFTFPGAAAYTGASIDDEQEDTADAEEVEDTDAEELTEEAVEQEEVAEETEATTEDTDEDFSYEPLFQDLVAEGILHDNEDGYDDSPEGFRQAVLDSRDREVEKYIETLPPTAQRIMQLALKGAQEDDIQQLLTLEDGPDWEEANLEDEDIQRAAVEEAMRLRDPDITDEEVEEAITDLIDLDKLQKQAEKDKKYLAKQQATQKAAVEAQVEARKEQAASELKQQEAAVKTYVDSVETIAGYKLTKADREGFMQYLTVKGKDGKTQAEKMNTPERRIQKEFLNYKDFNVAAIERQATTDITKNIKKQLARYPKGTGGGASQPVRVEKEVEGAIGRILLPGRGK